MTSCARRNFNAFLSLALLLCAAAGQATPLYSKDDFKIDFSGYIQEQWLDSGDFLGASFDLFQTRLRPVFDFNFGKGFSAEVSQTLLFSSGNALDNPLYKLSQDAAPPTYFRWDKRLVNDNEAWLDWSVYRAWAAYENDKMKVTLGRQRIAFGSALFYSPLDVFNPVSPLSLEPGERVGVDGVDCEIELGPSSYFSLAYGIGNVIDQSRFAAYYKTTVKTTDLHFLAARIFADWIAGAAFASNVKQGKLYGEASYTWPEQGKNYFRGTIGYQYNFSNGLLLTTEYYHNDGVIHASALGLADASAIFTQTNALATVDRNFLGVSAGFDLTELIRFNSALLLDLDAGSFYIGPSFSFSAPHSIALEAGAQLFSGNGKGDFGLLPDFDWARIRWDF